jgi:hypothetical protein
MHLNVFFFFSLSSFLARLTLSFFFPSLPFLLQGPAQPAFFLHSRAAQPAQSSPPPLLSLLSHAVKWAPPVGIVSYLEPDSSSNLCPTEVRRAAPPWARTSRPLGRPIKPPPRAISPVNGDGNAITRAFDPLP